MWNSAYTYSGMTLSCCYTMIIFCIEFTLLWILYLYYLRLYSPVWGQVIGRYHQYTLIIFYIEITLLWTLYLYYLRLYSPVWGQVISKYHQWICVLRNWILRKPNLRWEVLRYCVLRNLSWERKKVLRKSWESPDKVLRKSWESLEKVLRTII